MSHSFLSPSKAGTWVKCPASLSLTSDIPKKNSSAALDGVAAHQVAASLILGEVVKEGDFTECLVNVTDEMLEAATMYADYVKQHGVYIPAFGDIAVEEHIECKSVHPNCHGTCDAFCINGDTDKTLLHVFDFKFGWSPVEAFENWQCICYASGILDYHTEIENVKIHIVQPRVANPIKTWTVTVDELNNYAAVLNFFARIATGSEPFTRAGLHCKNCANLEHCSTSTNFIRSVLDYVGYGNSVHEMTAKEVSTEITILREAYKLIEYRLDACEEYAKSIIKSGSFVPGYDIQPTSSRLKWNIKPDEVAALGSLLETNLVDSLKVKTPTQAKRLIDEKIVNSYSSRVQTGTKLVSVNPRKIFGGK